MSFKLTEEQLAIVEHCKSGKDLIVQAYAGASKTTTLSFVSKELEKQGKRGIYLAFNKDIAAEAKSKMASSVTCCTVHSLAYRNTSKELIDKLKFSMPYPTNLVTKYNIKDVLLKFKLKGDNEIKDKRIKATQILQMARNTVKEYCNSADDKINKSHVILVDFGLGIVISGRDKLEKDVLRVAKKVWKDIIDENSTYPLTHDAYLKLFSLGDCNLDYDYVMMDELQDTAPSTLVILNKQKCQKIGVGDHYQSIYQWRGAINAMDEFEGVDVLYLTKSFRFGNQVVGLANEILNYSGATKPLRGNDNVHTPLTPDVYNCYIYRTNQGALEQYINLASRGIKAHLSVNADEIKCFVQHYFSLDKGFDIKKPHALLNGFSKTSEIKEYLEENEDGDLKKFVNICDKNGYRIIEYLDNNTPVDQADCIIMTAHKVKGLEFDTVYIGDDFKVVNKDDEITSSEMELNLMYVSVTRAKKYINANNLRRFYRLLQSENLSDVVLDW